MSQPALRGAIALSIAAALLTIGMKTAAYLVTGSAGLMSDALEAGVNLLAAGTAYFSLWYAARPPDPSHTFGHEKIEYFASGFEGGLILVAGLGTAYYAVVRLIHPQPLQRLELGGALSAGAAAINFVVARILLRLGRQYGSPVVVADGHHLMTDVYTTAGVLGGLALVWLTGWPLLDPLLALAIGLNILWTGVRLVRQAIHGLMDHALPPDVQDRLRTAIRATLPPGADFHALRTRRAGQRAFAEFHLLVAGGMSVREAHAIAHRVEEAMADVLPGLSVTTHIEPIDERASWETVELSRLGERGEP
jgi:cation diffusion facilitator family transporter